MIRKSTMVNYKHQDSMFVFMVLLIFLFIIEHIIGKINIH